MDELDPCPLIRQSTNCYDCSGIINRLNRIELKRKSRNSIVCWLKQYGHISSDTYTKMQGGRENKFSEPEFECYHDSFVQGNSFEEVLNKILNKDAL